MDQNVNPVLYIFVNTDLKLRMGRTAAQVAHVTHIITDTIVRDIYENMPLPEYCYRYLQWCKKPTTVILRATTTELLELLKLSESLPFYDNLESNHSNLELTVVGMYPQLPSKHDFSSFKLL